MLPELDYRTIGQRIKAARQEANLTQAELGALVGCSNNHMSHVEVGQTKVSLPMLVKIAFVLKKELPYFLFGTPYAGRSYTLDTGISEKLQRCSEPTLLAVGKMIDILLEQQERFTTE